MTTDKEQNPTPEKPEEATEEKANASEEKPAIKAKTKKTTRKTAAKKTTAGSKNKTAKSRSEHLTKLLALQEARKEGAVKGTVAAKTKKKKTAATKKKTVAKKKTTAKKTTKAAAAKPVAAASAPAKPKRRRKRKPPYTKRELKELKLMLEEERDRLLRDLRQLDELADSGRETTHATFSSHQADAASDSASLESTFIQRRYEEERFAAVSEALMRLENGTYGLCEMCAEEPQGHCETCPFIPVERLRAKPFAKMCVQLKQVMEKKYRRR